MRGACCALLTSNPRQTFGANLARTADCEVIADLIGKRAQNPVISTLDAQQHRVQSIRQTELKAAPHWKFFQRNRGVTIY